MSRPYRAREPLAITLRRNLAREEVSNALLPDDDPRKARNAARIAQAYADLPPLPRKRQRPAGHADPARPLEKNVLAAVLDALRLDPRVGYAWRQSSGVFREGDRYINVGPRGLPDILGVLRGTGRALFIEVKRDGRAKPEPHQLEFLHRMRSLGAVAGWCWSVESALALLP